MALHCADGQVTWTLPAELNIYQVGALKSELETALAHQLPLTCALNAVEDIDTAGIQLLLLAQRECARAGQTFALAGNSPASADALRVLGLHPATLAGVRGGMQ